MDKKRLTDYLPFNLVSQQSKAWVSCSMTEPTGDGVRDLNFILRGPVVGDMSQWFDTYNGVVDQSPQWYGLHWSQIKSINSIFFMHGPHFYEGGWWTTLHVQYMDTAGVWQEINSITITPSYSFDDKRDNRRPFEAYEIRFPSVDATAIRLLGQPGGLYRFTTMAYLNAGYTTPEQGAEYRVALQLPQPELLQLIRPDALWDLISSLRTITNMTFDVHCREGLGLDHFLDGERHQQFHEHQVNRQSDDPTSLYMILGTHEGWDVFNKEMLATREAASQSHQPEIGLHHGGMIWMVIPVVVDGVLLGTIENRNLMALAPLDHEWHEAAPERLGINRESYEAALKQVPIYKEAYLNSVMQHVQVVIRMARQQIQSSMEVANLRAKKEAVEEVNQAKTIFLGRMSHEIRTPLHAIVALTNLMLDTELDDLQQYYIENIHKSNESLLRLVNDLLDFSKIESGKLKLEEQPFDLYRCLQESIDLLATKAADKGLYLTHRISHQTPQFVQGDVSRLRQVLVNLLDNGLKFTEEGGVSLFVDSQVVKNGYHRLHFRINDTGIGIPPDRLHRLFKLFSQVDGSMTRKYSGVGLGLAISKELIEIMGGTIWVESKAEEGQGSVFHFTLTLPVISESVLPSQRPPTAIDSRMGTDHPLRILVADDQPVNLTVARHLLNRLGYRADVAMNGLEVLQALQRQHYDVVLMDLQMPEMDGLEATRAIKIQFPPEKQPRIIAVTANTEPGAREACFAAGMDDYISKPVRIEDFVVVLGQSTSQTQIEPLQPAVEEAQPASKTTIEVSSDESVPVQVELFEEMMGPDSFELLVEILETFLLEIPNNLPHLRRAIVDNDAQTVRQIAHSLKGTASSVTAQPLADVARSLETQARHGDLSDAEQKVEQIEKEFLRLEAWVKANLPSSASFH